jgi:hypothetical protein
MHGDLGLKNNIGNRIGLYDRRQTHPLPLITFMNLYKQTHNAAKEF